MEFLKELSSIHPYLPHVFIASIVIALYILCEVIKSFFSSVVRAIEAWQAPNMPPKPPDPPPAPKNRHDVLLALIAERDKLKLSMVPIDRQWQRDTLERLSGQIDGLLKKA